MNNGNYGTIENRRVKSKFRIENMGCIYIAKNIINGKCYIGKTVKNMQHRMAWHHAAATRGEGWAFHRALRKYGIRSFSWRILYESNIPEELAHQECKYIKECNTKRPAGYNLTSGGDGAVGRTPEVIAKIVAFHTGRKRSDETRRRISIATKGRRSRLGVILSDEIKRKISMAVTGFKHTDEAKAKIGVTFRGKPKSLEQRAKMSQARKLWWSRRDDRVTASEISP